MLSPVASVHMQRGRHDKKDGVTDVSCTDACPGAADNLNAVDCNQNRGAFFFNAVTLTRGKRANNRHSVPHRGRGRQSVSGGLRCERKFQSW